VKPGSARRLLGAAAVCALALAGSAGAHGPASPRQGAFVATVSSIDPNVVGLRARVVRGDEILVANLTRDDVVILGRDGGTLHRIPAGTSRAWHDSRVTADGPPPRVEGSAPVFVKDWQIPGRAGGQSFAIEGFLGYVPPRGSGEGGTSPLVYVLSAAGLLAVAGLAVLLLERRLH
jgi:hypothetical protein